MSALIVIAGQSNALGYGVTPAELPGAWHTDPDVMIWRTDHFEVMQPGVNTGTPANPQAWGPEVGFAMAWRAEHPGQTLYLVKVAKGSTGLADDPAQLDWSPESHELFQAATDQVAAARVAAWLPVSAILWMQGEQDAVDPTKAGAYEGNLRDLFAHMRTDWGGFDTPIVFGRIGAAAHLAYGDAVRAAQSVVDVGDPLAVMVDTDHDQVQADQLHMSGGGQIAFGQALEAALDDLQSPPLRVHEHDRLAVGWSLP